MFYQIDKKYIWVSDSFSIDETVEFLIKKLSPPNQKIQREKFVQLVLNQKK
jgi:hypothetical protein